MHWWTPSKSGLRFLSTALAYGRHSESAPELGRQKTAPGAECVRVAPDTQGRLAGRQFPAAPAVGGAAGGADNQAAPDSATAGRSLRGNSLAMGALDPRVEVPSEADCHAAAP